MLNQPPINDLEKKAGSRYILVSAVAKRARKHLSDSVAKAENLRKQASAAGTTNQTATIEIRSDADVLENAIDELMDDKLTIVQPVE